MSSYRQMSPSRRCLRPICPGQGDCRGLPDPARRHSCDRRLRLPHQGQPVDQFRRRRRPRLQRREHLHQRRQLPRPGQCDGRGQVQTSQQATLAEKITSLYKAIIPTAKQSADGLAFLTRPDGLKFYQDVAKERGITAENGPAVVALASLLKVAVDGKNGIGNPVSDLIASIADGSSGLPATSTSVLPIETVDGTKFDADDAPDVMPGSRAQLLRRSSGLRKSSSTPRDSNDPKDPWGPPARGSRRAIVPDRFAYGVQHGIRSS